MLGLRLDRRTHHDLVREPVGERELLDDGARRVALLQERVERRVVAEVDERDVERAVDGVDRDAVRVAVDLVGQVEVDRLGGGAVLVEVDEPVGDLGVGDHQAVGGDGGSGVVEHDARLAVLAPGGGVAGAADQGQVGPEDAHGPRNLGRKGRDGLRVGHEGPAVGGERDPAGAVLRRGARVGVGGAIGRGDVASAEADALARRVPVVPDGGGRVAAVACVAGEGGLRGGSCLVSGQPVAEHPRGAGLAGGLRVAGQPAQRRVVHHLSGVGDPQRVVGGAERQPVVVGPAFDRLDVTDEAPLSGSLGLPRNGRDARHRAGVTGGRGCGSGGQDRGGDERPRSEQAGGLRTTCLHARFFQ